MELYAGSVWLFWLFSPREIKIKDESENRHLVWRLLMCCYKYWDFCGLFGCYIEIHLVITSCDNYSTLKKLEHQLRVCVCFGLFFSSYNE